MPACVRPRPGRLAAALVLYLLNGLACAAADEQPRLLLSAADLPRLRHTCGVGPPGEAAAWGRFAARAADFQALRAHFSRRVDGVALPGEVLAAAFLHLVDPRAPEDAARLALVAATLEQPPGVTADELELAVALDWCWEGLPPQTRRDFINAARQRAEPLDPGDSPLDPRRFRARLAALALALAVDRARDPSPSWSALRERLLAAGREHLASRFGTFVSWRGLSPTGPAAAAREECDTAVALELGGRLLGRDPWPEHRATVGRWLEHYLLATLEHPRLAHHFIRDDGRLAPLTPAPSWEALLPVTAHLIAARARDPAAARVADRVEAALRSAPDDALAGLWRWVPIAFDTTGVPRCDLARLPPARNFGGAVLFRGGDGPDATAVWIEAGQPYLRRGQHFDAGHFLIYRGGHLAVGGGDDVAFEAVPGKGGAQGLGQERGPFDFEQYCTATIAHNAVVIWDPAGVARWYGALYRPVGGQRCIDGTCTDFITPLEAQGRLTARQLAYGCDGACGYLALDLAPAYEPRTLRAYTREFIFLWGRALVVVDRLHLATGRLTPTWIINLPARPQVDGRDLGDEARSAGVDGAAGVWGCDAVRWLRWTDGDGALWLTAPLPAPKRIRVVGGPARRQVVTRGPHAARVYIGGEPDGFERLILPADRRGALNAWYRLGEPTLLGPEIGKTPHWGRIEIEPARPAAQVTFLTVLVSAPADAAAPPEALLEQTGDDFVLRLAADGDRAVLRLPAGAAIGGALESDGPGAVAWTLPLEVAADPPLPAAP